MADRGSSYSTFTLTSVSVCVCVTEGHGLISLSLKDVMHLQHRKLLVLRQTLMYSIVTVDSSDTFVPKLLS